MRRERQKDSLSHIKKTLAVFGSCLGQTTPSRPVSYGKNGLSPTLHTHTASILITNEGAGWYSRLTKSLISFGSLSLLFSPLDTETYIREKGSHAFVSMSDV